MKENKLIIGIFIAIFIVVIFDVVLIISSKKKNEISKEPEIEAKEVTYADKYFCIKQEQTSTMTNGGQFKFIEQYEFMVINNEVNNGNYKDTISLENEENYKYFINNYIDENNTYFTIEHNEENYKVIYYKNMIFNAEEKQDLTFSEEYLDYLKKQNFICEKIETEN